MKKPPRVERGMSPWRTISARFRRELLRLHGQGRVAILRLRLTSEWRKSSDGLKGRVYPDYQTYRKHQAVKLDALREKSIAGHDQRFYASLRERLEWYAEGFAGKRVICLGARQGTEVRAFIDLGAFAVGIDLNPGRDNRYVLVGDFHDLQFADDTVDVIYTNALDHAFDIDRILSEVNRVLIPGGLLICEVGLGTDAGANPGAFESFAWERIDDVVNHLNRHSFTVVSRTPFQLPWRGEHLVLRQG